MDHFPEYPTYHTPEPAHGRLMPKGRIEILQAGGETRSCKVKGGLSV